jgi:hypothetical protein
VLIAWWGWEREQRRLGTVEADVPGIPEEHAGALVRFGGLRAPATLFSQLIFS